MYRSIVPITEKTHLTKKVKPLKDFNFAQNVNLASVMAHEFSKAGAVYPIVFLEDKASDTFRPVVLLGLEEGENLFVEDGKWKSSYVPAIIRRYPFTLASSNEEGRFTICVDDESELLNDEEGEALFDEEGNASELMERVKKYLGELYQMEKFTTQFCQEMQEKNMFTPLNMRVKVANEIKSLGGAYVINEERLNALSDEAYLELRSKQFMAVIYSHLTSLSQIERLLTFKNASK
jgi:hypothetical protein